MAIGISSPTLPGCRHQPCVESDWLWLLRLRRFRLLLLPLRLLLLQLLLLLLFLLGDMMSDCATGRGAHQCVMAGHVSRNGAYRSTFDATFRCRGLSTGQEGKPQQRHGESLHFHLSFPRHAILPCEQSARV